MEKGKTLLRSWTKRSHCRRAEQAELGEMIEEIAGASDKVRSSVKEKSAVVSEKRKPELKGCCATLALRLFAHGSTLRTRAKLGLRHWPINRPHRRLHNEQK